MGLSPRIEGEEMKVDAEGFAGGDRTIIDLPKPQQKFLEQIHARASPRARSYERQRALYQLGRRKSARRFWKRGIPAKKAVTAIAAFMAGDFNPSGRLPVTFYKSVDQLPPFEDYSMAKRTYRYFDGEPLYPFGYGLSYTSFGYTNPKIDQPKVAADGTVNVSVSVGNSGKLAGDEVVQLYLTHAGVNGAPIRSLQAFKRVHLNPGMQSTVTFKLSDRQLSVVDEAGKRRIVPGAVKVWIGGGQPVSRPGLPKTPGVETQFEITSEATLPD